MFKNNCLKFILLSLSFICLNVSAQKDIDTKVQKLLKKMTLEEKIGQMVQLNGFWDFTGPAPKDGDGAKWKYDALKSGKVGSVLNVRGVKNVRQLQEMVVNESRLGIPLIFGFDVIHGHKTVFPIPLAESASWDLDAMENAARIAAIEASAEGLNWTFAPMVDISRDARWGRVMEGAGEDPYLASEVAKARVKGFQGKDLSDDNTLAACAKHFVGYGFAESGKDYNAVDVGTSTLYNVLLPPFQACIDANVRTFMNAFNTLNGIPATGDDFLQRDILKGKWNFDGFVVSDWGSISEMQAHGFAKDLKDAGIIAANAGCDMDMESYAYVGHLKEAVEEGTVAEALIDDAAARILKVKFELGLFDDPYKYCDTKKEKELLYHPDHKKAALDMAKKSIVLLKNEGNLLPLDKKQKNIAIIGALADEDNSPLGNWRLGTDNNTAVSFLEGFKKYTDNYSYEKGVDIFLKAEDFLHEVEVNNTDKSGIDAAVALAKKSEVVIMVLGEHGYQSGEGRSRANLDLPGLQKKMLKEVYKVNKNIILVLMNGRPLTIDWEAENIPAILETWQLGTESGNAIAETLFGDNIPGGKLTMTFPRTEGQVPIYYNYLNTGRPGPIDLVFWSHYTDETNAPLYPFGYGLSYTDFAYDNMKVVNNGNNIQVSVNVKNTGNYDGSEVVQLYIRDKVASVSRPVKELKGFEKIFLKKGENKTVNFTLTEKELGFYNNRGDFVVEPGDFDVMVGTSSLEGLSDSFEWK